MGLGFVRRKERTNTRTSSGKLLVNYVRPQGTPYNPHRHPHKDRSEAVTGKTQAHWMSAGQSSWVC